MTIFLFDSGLVRVKIKFSLGIRGRGLIHCYTILLLLTWGRLIPVLLRPDWGRRTCACGRPGEEGLWLNFIWRMKCNSNFMRHYYIQGAAGFMMVPKSGVFLSFLTTEQDLSRRVQLLFHSIAIYGYRVGTGLLNKTFSNSSYVSLLNTKYTKIPSCVYDARRLSALKLWLYSVYGLTLRDNFHSTYLDRWNFAGRRGIGGC